MACIVPNIGIRCSKARPRISNSCFGFPGAGIAHCTAAQGDLTLFRFAHGAWDTQQASFIVLHCSVFKVYNNVTIAAIAIIFGQATDYVFVLHFAL